ncbi:MAG: hypothetical protein E7602_01320 [Ruminococcaceae bacterium]|nr:hypothetical protein [Oscillospiraceae bacterium]
MKKYLEKFLKDFEYKESDAEYLLQEYSKIQENEEANKGFNELIELYNKTIEFDYYKDFLVKAEEAGKLADVHPYTSGLLIFMCISKHLKELYDEKGISEEIYHNSMLDLRYKLEECKLVKGIVGSFVAWWFPGFFAMTRFALGRLQFELSKYEGEEYTKNGKTLRKGDIVINVHIPRSETPITKEATDDAYAQAAKFFIDQIPNKQVVFVCHSWLLYSETLEVFPKHSNTYRFIHEFDVTWNSYDKEGVYNDAWRLFDMDFTGDINDYPENNSMRRAYKQFLLNGGRTGEGFGIIMY